MTTQIDLQTMTLAEAVRLAERRARKERAKEMTRWMKAARAALHGLVQAVVSRKAEA